MTTEQTVSAADVYKMWLKAPKLWRCGKWTVSKFFFLVSYSHMVCFGTVK